MPRPLSSRALAALCAVVTLAACTMAPRYERPKAPVSGRYRGDPAGATERALPEWKSFFRDGRLRSLIVQALRENRDLRMLSLRAEQVRAQYRIQRADLFPAIQASGVRNQQRVVSPLFPGRGGISYTQYTLSVGMASYELDFWGRIQSLKDEALEQYLASVAARRSAEIGLVAQVATQYFTLMALSEQLRVAEAILASAREAKELIARSLEAGTRTALDLHASEALMATTEANIALLRQQRFTADNALCVLLGGTPEVELPTEVTLDASRQLAELRAGLPSSLLERRPDILEAEHQLKAANANIGAARAAFFPRIALTAAGGAASNDILGLFKKGSGTWQFVPQISIPLFSAGQKFAELDVAKLRKQSEVANYERAIQVAFREVSDALGSQALIDSQLTARSDASEAQIERNKLASARYKAGLDSYLVLLTAQQDLYEAEQALVQIKLTKLSNLVALYRALGGGFDET